MRELARTKWKWIEGLFGVAKNVGGANNVSGSFGIFPSNKQGKNVVLREHRKQGEYALQLTFDFWSRYEVDVRNVDARYEASGVPIEAKILFDNQEVALNSAISRFTRGKKLEANSITSIGIWRVFRRDCTQDHGIATVDVELSGPTWEGMHVLHIEGRLGPLGVWENVNFTFSHLLSGEEARWSTGSDIPKEPELPEKATFSRLVRRVPPRIWVTSGSVLAIAFILGVQVSRISIVKEFLGFETAQQFEGRAEELVARHKLRQGQRFSAPDGLFWVTFTNFGWGSTACFRTEPPKHRLFIGDCVEVGQRFLRFTGSDQYTVTLVDRSLDMSDDVLNHVWIQVVKRSAPPPS